MTLIGTVHVEVEVTAEHTEQWLAAVQGGRPTLELPESIRHYQHVFSGARPLPADVAESLGVPPNDPEAAAYALAASTAFVAAMKPGSVRLRRRTVTITEWEDMPA